MLHIIISGNNDKYLKNLIITMNGMYNPASPVYALLETGDNWQTISPNEATSS
jgi:hypothetical protein